MYVKHLNELEKKKKMKITYNYISVTGQKHNKSSPETVKEPLKLDLIPPLYFNVLRQKWQR